MRNESCARNYVISGTGQGCAPLDRCDMASGGPRIIADATLACRKTAALLNVCILCNMDLWLPVWDWHSIRNRPMASIGADASQII